MSCPVCYAWPVSEESTVLLLDQVTALARQASGLRLLILFGSRARGDAHARSDWDFGFLAGRGFDPDELLTRLTILLWTDRIDLVDLSLAGGLLRFRAASDGKILFETTAGTFERFWLEAVSFWCDAGPVLEEAYEAVLEGLRS